MKHTVLHILDFGGWKCQVRSGRFIHLDRIRMYCPLPVGRVHNHALKRTTNLYNTMAAHRWWVVWDDPGHVDEIDSAAHFNGSEFTLGPQGSAQPFYTVGNQQSVVLLPRTVRLDKPKSEQDWIVKKTGAIPDTEARLRAIIAAEFVSNWFKREKRNWEFDLIRRLAELYGGRIKTRFRDVTVHYQPFYEVRK